jgi:serine/threonine-protein kinase
MLTGRRVFEGEDVSDTLAAVLRGEPEYAALPADTPPAVRTLIKRCLERDRRRRVASLSTALFVIDEATSLTTSSPPARSTQADEAALRTRVETAVSEARRALMLRRVLPAMAALAVIVVSGAIVAWWFRAVDVPPIVTRFSIPVRQGVLALGRPVLAISNDGSSLAYAANRELFLRLVSDFSVRAIQAGDVGSGVIHSLVFSPDDRALAFFSDGDIRRVNIGGGGAVTVCSARQPWGMTWHATGLIVGQGPFGIVRCHANGGSPEPLVKVGEGELAHGPQILPGDDALLFTLAKTSNGASLWDSAEIVVQSLTTGERKTIVRGGSDARYLPTGHLVYAVGGVVLAAPFDARRREVSGSAVPVIEGVRRSIGTTGSAHFVTSLTGSLMYVPGPTGLMSAAWALATSDRAGTPTRLAIPPGPYVHVRASRDGTHLAVGSDTGSEAIVWIHRLAGDSAMRRLTLTGRNRFPTWLPDGQRVAFQSDREGDAGIFVQRIDGTGGAERLTKAATGEAHVPEAWSPDGRYLLFSVTKESSYALWMYSAADKTVRPFGGVQSREPTGAVFSADGRWVAYASTPVEGGTRSPNRGIFVQPFPPTGDTYQVPPEIFDFHPAWSPTSMDLIYIPAAASGDISVVRMTTTGGVTFSSPTRSPALLTAQRTSNLARVWDTLPDGRFVGLVSPVSDAGADASELRVVINWFEELKQRVPRGR